MTGVIKVAPIPIHGCSGRGAVMFIDIFRHLVFYLIEDNAENFCLAVFKYVGSSLNEAPSGGAGLDDEDGPVHV